MRGDRFLLRAIAFCWGAIAFYEGRFATQRYANARFPTAQYERSLLGK
ncbi:MAG TPA: hypothetical protein V6C58_11985 [Allocoleopsis sp.]